MQDGAGRYLEEYKNHHISSDFYEIWPNDTLHVHNMYKPQLSDFVRFWCIFCMVSFSRRVGIAGGRFWCAACNSVNRTCSTSTLLLFNKGLTCIQKILDNAV